MSFWFNFQRRYLHTIHHKGSPLRLVHDTELLAGLAQGRGLRGQTLAQPPLGALAAIAQTDKPTVADDALACFSHKGSPLPCLLTEDRQQDPSDPWLTAPTAYPFYARLFAAKAAEVGAGPRRPLRLLEIGVRTGYIGVVLARATGGITHYTGIDPNLYLPDGLERAEASLRLIREELPAFSYQLITGYSTGELYQDPMALCGPYDIIHIDGDHSLHGKITDLYAARKLLAPGGWLLVDDYGHAPSVAPACATALSQGWYARAEYVPTYRGMCALFKI